MKKNLCQLAFHIDHRILVYRACQVTSLNLLIWRTTKITPYSNCQKTNLKNETSIDFCESMYVKSLFITSNRFSPFVNDSTEEKNTSNESPINDNFSPYPTIDHQSTKKNLQPPIFVRGILDFVDSRNELIKLLFGVDNFS